jgi:phosphoglycolate phosphatase-like HAD superfamily hydrolase
MIRLLILTCGTNANYHISKLLKNNYGESFYLIGTDINPQWQIPTSPYLNFFHQCPPTSDNEYYDYILEVSRKEHADYILPSFDEDQQMFYDGNPHLKAIGVQSLGINAQIRDIYSSKQNLNAFLNKNHFPIPHLYSLKDLDGNTDYFVKPTNGVGSVGARIMKGDEIDQTTASLNIIEEKCQEPEVTLECFVYKGNVFSVARKRIAQKNGVCTKAKVYDDRELTKVAQRFADILPLPHIFNLQFMRNSFGEYVITDVNLRTAAGMSMSYAAGWDETSALADLLLHRTDEEITKHVQPIKQEHYIMRAYTDIVTKRIEKRIAFDLDGTLLDSRGRHKTVMDQTLTLFNIHLNTDNLVSYKAEGHNNVEWLVENGIERDTANAIQNKWIELIEADDYLLQDKLYEGAFSALERLSKTNELFLITSRNNEKGAMGQLKRHGLLRFFSGVKIIKPGLNVSQAKATYLKENGIDVMIGDTEVDLKAAQLANCNYKAVTHGFRSITFWNKYHAEILSLKQLPQILSNPSSNTPL